MSVLSLTPEPATAPLPAEGPASAAAADAAALTRILVLTDLVAGCARLGPRGVGRPDRADRVGPGHRALAVLLTPAAMAALGLYRTTSVRPASSRSRAPPSLAGT